MTAFALFCPPYYSHLRLFEALAEELISRGHAVNFIVNAGAAAMVGLSGPGILVHEVGRRSDEAMRRLVSRAGNGRNPLSILRTVRDSARLTDEFCRKAPALCRSLGIEAILGDQMEPAAGLVAAHLGLPHVSVAAALPVHDDPTVPLPFLDWPYDPSEAGLKRNRGGVMVARILLRRQNRTIARWAERFGLPPRHSLADCLSTTCQISQLTESFDFPRQASPRQATSIRHAVGPIRAAARGGGTLPIRRDPGRPLVFASFGTLQGHRLRLFRKIAEACRRVGADCVIAHCGALDAAAAATIDARLVTDFVPQQAMLAEADLCVTHAGINTVLDALAAGKPMLAIPMAFDQPGIAARIVHHGVGLRPARGHLSVASLADCLERLLQTPSFTANARRIGADIRDSGGVRQAADLIEATAAAGGSPGGREGRLNG
ncbi:glycosyltransferase [Jiella sonneratiae]|uniref:Glycosyltransferase family 1 protein n=1 Tax=Jiella sonneratiae TaxID=2816856 RepID=A0ABS3J8E6_9HYPH|nr:glycosyltransferase [Jiella sonneratiae]MBO0905940.1 glycosyltransferase family 1 protein [Jiella sonneratiae]